jgi:holliday junction DNA helicase RuvB
MKFSNLLSKLISIQSEPFFEEIIGYDHIKRLFRMALDSDSAIHILLVGPPASAKTMFLTSLMQLKNSYFSDGANSTKAGMIDYVKKTPISAN